MADSAGEILRRSFQSDIAVENKAVASPVTKADREVETAAALEIIEKEFPEHGIIGEEFGNVPERFVLSMGARPHRRHALAFIAEAADLYHPDRTGRKRHSHPRHHRPTDNTGTVG